MKTQGEKILKEFFKEYNKALADNNDNIYYSYNVYVQKIPVNTKEESNDDINCTVLEIIRNEKVDDDIKQTIIYEDYKPNVHSMFTSMKERLISTFIVKGLSTLIGALEHINNEYERHQPKTDK